jgi:hypothetical protein
VPNVGCHASADHVVLTRLPPAGPQSTRIGVGCFVDRDAVKGRDYELERLLPFWALTSEPDWVRAVTAEDEVARTADQSSAIRNPADRRGERRDARAGRRERASHARQLLIVEVQHSELPGAAQLDPTNPML